ncbi:MAG: glycosyltransferase N-terminal domain-containing protein [Thermodesulfobacteriota bacterium]|nr:glycosyltransferase N-terminal domain-containing protein [Thermodesulfobacteriota bacterium]
MIHPLYMVYTFAGAMVYALTYPFVRLYMRLARQGNDCLNQRLGRYPVAVEHIPGTPRIWIHAASVGEVRVAAAVIAAFKKAFPECAVILSTMTAHGHAFAVETVGSDAACIFVPLDFIFPVKRAFDTLAPDVFVVLETEIWPHLFVQAKKRGMVTAILNGRISERNQSGYKRFRSFFRAILSHVDVMSMISAADADRIIALGGRPDRVFVNGNAKYDGLSEIVKDEVPARLRRRLQLRADVPVFIAGSTRQNEEATIARSYRKICEQFPETVLIVAPRHIERIPAVTALLRQEGLEWRLLTEIDADVKRGEKARPVIVVDTIGELMNLYSIASFVFCGGSLVPLGGQNILEPAAWGIPVFYGPFMDDFKEAKEMLESRGGGMEIKDASDLAARGIELLANPEKALMMGNAAKTVIQMSSTAAERHVRLLCDYSDL